jgi:hypothetical protein
VAVLIVVDNPAKWPFAIAGVDVVDARSYLTRPEYSEMRGVKLINLCRSYSYQTSGYYVSLLAEARGHKPLPSVTTIQDMKSQAFRASGLGRSGRTDAAEPVADPVGEIHAEHLFRP